jgi:uncharacterized membrane protein
LITEGNQDAVVDYEPLETLQQRRVRQVELLISRLLRVGVLLSLTVVTIGAVITFMHHREYVSSRDALEQVTSKDAAFPHSASQVLHGLASFEGRSVIMLGLLLLIATPVMRVAVSIFAFMYEHDTRYVVITTIVLVFLLLGFLLGKVEG